MSLIRGIYVISFHILLYGEAWDPILERPIKKQPSFDCSHITPLTSLHYLFFPLPPTTEKLEVEKSSTKQLRGALETPRSPIPIWITSTVHNEEKKQQQAAAAAVVDLCLRVRGELGG